MPLSQHRCRRFERLGVPCPFRKTKRHEDDDEDPEPKELERVAEKAGEGTGFQWDDALRWLSFPMRGRPRYGEQQRFKGFPRPIPAPAAVPMPEEQGRAIPDPRQIPLPFPDAAIEFQDGGGLSFLPNLRQLLSEPSHQNLIAMVSALMIFEGLRRSGSSPFGTPSQTVGRLETQSASQLKQLSGVSQSPTSGRGRGGFHVNAAQRLSQQLGRTPLRKRKRIEGVYDPDGAPSPNGIDHYPF